MYATKNEVDPRITFVTYGVCISDGVSRGRVNLIIYQARESSMVPVGFLTAQFLHKLYIYENLVVTFPFTPITTMVS